MPTIFEHFAIMKPDLMLDQLQVSPDIYQQLGARYDGFRAHLLISAHEFSENWSTWEKHPAGDELVILLSGAAQLLIRQETGDERITLEAPGDFAIVPRDTWHTARVAQPTRMLSVTPGEGTENEISPPG